LFVFGLSVNVLVCYLRLFFVIYLLLLLSFFTVVILSSQAMIIVTGFLANPLPFRRII